MTPVIAEDEWVVFGEEFIDLEHTCQPSCLPKKCSCDFLYPNSYYIELSGASLSNMVNTSHVWLFNLKWIKIKFKNLAKLQGLTNHYG